MLYAEGKYDDALKAMSAAADAEDKTEKHPVTPGVPTPARELYGTMLLERGLTKEALAAFEATLNKEPHRLGAELGAGAAAEKSGDADKARAHYAAAVALTQNTDPCGRRSRRPAPSCKAAVRAELASRAGSPYAVRALIRSKPSVGRFQREAFLTSSAGGGSHSPISAWRTARSTSPGPGSACD